MIIVGLMSGTSADGIDAAVVRFERKERTLWMKTAAFVEVAYPPMVRQCIWSLFPPHLASARAVCEANVSIGGAFAEAVGASINKARLGGDEVDLIVSHGQTIYHQVKPGHVRSTLQIGSAAVIAERTGITTVADLRPRDIAAGGQGAPLVSYVDYLLFHRPGMTRAVQNIGGIGNVTVLGETVFAFDTGPGNALIDQAAFRLSNGALRCDLDGQWAAQGSVNPRLLDGLLAHPYFAQKPPKTTGRELFGARFADLIVEQGLAQGMSPPDILATLTALTARSIARAYADFVPGSVDEVILSGGGQRNPALVAMIKQELGPIPVFSADELGISSDGKEAISFAVLGYLTVHGWPGTLPACTGAYHPAVLGNITPGKNYRRLLAQIASARTDPPTSLRVQP